MVEGCGLNGGIESVWDCKGKACVIGWMMMSSDAGWGGGKGWLLGWKVVSGDGGVRAGYCAGR